MTTDKVQENYYRRMAKRLGYVLKKSHGKQWSIDNQLGYMVVNARNVVALGGKFDADLDDVAEYLKAKEKELKNG